MLSLKTGVDVPTQHYEKSKKIFRKKLIFVATLKATARVESGSGIQCTDPRIRIRIKMSLIQNTELLTCIA